MILSIQEARDILRIDGSDNDIMIAPLIEALPDYIELQTGMSPDRQDLEPMCKTVAGFILQMWYFGEHCEIMKIQRVIDSLLKCITLKARE